MRRVVAYHRPTELGSAVALLGRPEVDTRVLAGGTLLNAGFQELAVEPVEVLDLQALGLDGITRLPDAELRIGAMTTLAGVAGSTLVPSVLRDLARAEAPSTLRNMATLGGTVSHASFESALLAGMVAADARVEMVGPTGSSVVSLGSLLDGTVPIAGAIITALTIRTDGTFSEARTARTPADTPIVAVVGRRAPNGAITLAGSGIASAVVAFTDASTLEPPGDFRGSTAYRRSVAATLAGRVLAALHDGSPPDHEPASEGSPA